MFRAASLARAFSVYSGDHRARALVANGGVAPACTVCSLRRVVRMTSIDAAHDRSATSTRPM